MLSEGLVVLRVEYVVIEVVSPSDLRPLPMYSDCVTSSSLSKNLQTLTANRRGYVYGSTNILIVNMYCIIQLLNTRLHTYMHALQFLHEHGKFGPSSFVL